MGEGKPSKQGLGLVTLANKKHQDGGEGTGERGRRSDDKGSDWGWARQDEPNVTEAHVEEIKKSGTDQSRAILHRISLYTRLRRVPTFVENLWIKTRVASLRPQAVGAAQGSPSKERIRVGDGVA